MANSRTRLKAKSDDKPTNTNKGHGLILETPYKPGFVDDLDLETIKMAVDKEFADISNAFYKSTERTADTLKKIDKIEIDGNNQYGELLAKIEEVDFVSKEGDVALAQRITTFEANVDNEFGKTNALITEETNARASADEALTQRITEFKAELDTEIGKNTALITDETTARVSADEALAQRVESILGSMEGDLGPLVGQIEEQFRVLAKQDEVLAESIRNVTASYEQADKDLSGAIKAEESVRITEDTALATRIDQLRADVTTADATLSGAITSEEQARVTEDAALAQRINELRADMVSGDSALSAAVKSEEQARVDADSANAAYTSRVEAEYKNADAGLDGKFTGEVNTIKASVTSETQARVDGDSAVSSKVDNVHAELNGQIANVNVTAQTALDKAGNIEAKWGVTVEANGAISGIELNSGADKRSEIKMYADRITFTDGSSDVKPITIMNGQAAFNNVLIRENCQVLGTIQAGQVRGVKQLIGQGSASVAGHRDVQFWVNTGVAAPSWGDDQSTYIVECSTGGGFTTDQDPNYVYWGAWATDTHVFSHWYGQTYIWFLAHLRTQNCWGNPDARIDWKLYKIF